MRPETPGGEEVTRWLEGAANGDPDDAQKLLERVYRELHALAQAQMRRERGNHTLQTTALVHEAYLRLLGPSQPVRRDRAGFFAAAAEAMRRILIEHARRRGRLKRGGGWRQLALEDVLTASDENLGEIVAVDQALRRLESVDPRAAEVVRLRFYAGLGFPEIAMILDTSERTVMREWAFARTSLYRLLRDDEADDET